MIKAAMVTPNMTLGGAERWVVDLIKHSDPSRVEWVGVAVSGHGGADTNLCKELAGHTTLYANKPQGERPAHALEFDFSVMDHITGDHFRETVFYASQDADVIVSWGQPNMSYWFVDTTVPCIGVSHTTSREKKNLPCSGLTHLAAVSEKAMTYFDGRGGARFLPRKVIYNGIDAARLMITTSRQELRQQWGIADDAKVILYLGRFSEEKNCFAAARAAKQLGQDYYAVYCGQGNEEGDLREFCDRHIPDRYRIYKPTTKVGDVFNASDCMVLASHREAFSLTLIEAWMFGLPVIGTPVGSLPELEDKHGPLAFRVTEGPSAESLAEQVALSVSNPNHEGIRERSQQLALAHFTVEKMAARWMDYLEEVVANGATS